MENTTNKRLSKRPAAGRSALTQARSFAPKMPKTASRPTASRRAVLADAASLPVIALAMAPAPIVRLPDVGLPLIVDAGPDAGLLAACREAIALDELTDRMQAATDDLMDDEIAWTAAQAKIDTELPWLCALFDAVAGSPARSATGLRAKAALLHEMLPKGRHGGPAPDADPRDILTWSLLRDLLGETTEANEKSWGSLPRDVRGLSDDAGRSA